MASYLRGFPLRGCHLQRCRRPVPLQEIDLHGRKSAALLQQGLQALDTALQLAYFQLHDMAK